MCMDRGMSLTSASTNAEVEAAYDTNADYDNGAGDVSKAQLFVQAGRFLMRRYATNASAGGTTFGRDVRVIQDELKRADAWLNLNDTARNTGSVTVMDMREARR